MTAQEMTVLEGIKGVNGRRTRLPGDRACFPMTPGGALQQTGGMSADRTPQPGSPATAPTEDRSVAPDAGADPGADADDPYLWLEDVTGERALSWVRERNAETVAQLTVGARFEALRAEIREVLDSTDRIPYIGRGGEYRYNFWRDREHPRGLWRRTTLAEYSKERTDWEILLDVDALARDENENWVYHGARCLRPDYRRALVWLSRGGADAAVVREFDIERREFVTDGFHAARGEVICRLDRCRQRLRWYRLRPGNAHHQRVPAYRPAMAARHAVGAG